MISVSQCPPTLTNQPQLETGSEEEVASLMMMPMGGAMGVAPAIHYTQDPLFHVEKFFYIP